MNTFSKIIFGFQRYMYPRLRLFWGEVWAHIRKRLGSEYIFLIFFFFVSWDTNISDWDWSGESMGVYKKEMRQWIHFFDFLFVSKDTNISGWDWSGGSMGVYKKEIRQWIHGGGSAIRSYRGEPSITLLDTST